MIDYLLNEHPFASLIAAIIIVVALAIAIIDIPIYYAMDYSCGKKAEMLNSEHHFGYFEGCWVLDKSTNTWVEYTTIRNVEVK